MERRRDGRVYSKSHLKGTAIVRDLSQCLHGGKQLEENECFEILFQWLNRWYHLLLGDKMYKEMEHWDLT
jgi:hypothetical protein